MLPPGLSFNAISAKALAASKRARLPRSYFSWDEMLGPKRSGFFPYTPATNLLYGLREALQMLQEEGLEHVFPVTPATPRPRAVRYAPGDWKSCAPSPRNTATR